MKINSRIQCGLIGCVIGAIAGCHSNPRMQNCDCGQRAQVSCSGTCKLSSRDQTARAKMLRDTLFSKAIETRELPDGYAFKFPGDDRQVAELQDFIRFERQCCSFMTFELSFEPNYGPVTLRMRGGAEAKKILRPFIEQPN